MSRMFQTFSVISVLNISVHFMQSQFTSREVVNLTGITPRQLQWWDERGIVVPARKGHHRLYSMDNLAEVAVICELRRSRFPPDFGQTRVAESESPCACAAAKSPAGEAGR